MNRVNDFTNHFRGRKEISRDDIFNYLYSRDVTNINSIRSLIHRWTREGVLNKVNSNTYELSGGKKKTFQILRDDMQIQLSEIFTDNYPDLKYCVWNSVALNNMMTHQPFDSFYVFETEADVVDSVFYLLKEKGFNVFISPDENTMNKYVAGTKDAIVIKKLVSRAPLVRAGGLARPSLEKILVDILVDKSIFQFAQGSELANIYREAMAEYIVNMTTLLNYATRRNSREDIINAKLIINL